MATQMDHSGKVFFTNEEAPMLRSDHILRALDANGDEFFYTGRAGERWVSRNRSDAFAVTLEGGRNRACRFNANTALHGLWFIAVER